MIKNLKLLPLLSVFCLLATKARTQSDSVIVQGKIENLTFRQYRQANSVAVARINVLRADQEMVRAANLQPDGSFRLALPVVFPHEECYFTFGNSVLVPFMASAGTITLRINADSLLQPRLPVAFGGANAATNQRHAQFYAAFNKWLEKQPDLKDPLAKTAGRVPQRAWELLRNMRDRKQRFYENFAANSADILLNKWVSMSLDQEAKALFLIYLTRQKQAIPASLNDTLLLDNQPLLTFTKADCFRQFTQYAFQTTTQPRETTLPLGKLASILLQFVPKITTADSLKLEEIKQANAAKMKDLKLLNTLFERNSQATSSFVNFELYAKKYGAAFDSTTLDFLKTQFYVDNVSQLTVRQLEALYQYVKPQIKNLFYGASLTELHRVETRDSVAIRALDEVAFIDHSQGSMEQFVIDAGRGIYLYHNNLSPVEAQLQAVKKMYAGRKIYVLLWDNTDEFSRRAFLNARNLPAMLPNDDLQLVVVCTSLGLEPQVWKEAVLKSKLKGLHILCNSAAQIDGWFLEASTDQLPTAILINEVGKIIKNPAPLPGDREEWEQVKRKIWK